MKDEAQTGAEWLDAFNLVDDDEAPEAGGCEVEDSQDEGQDEDTGEGREGEDDKDAELAKLEVEAVRAWVDLTLAELQGKPIPPPPRLQQASAGEARAKANSRGGLPPTAKAAGVRLAVSASVPLAAQEAPKGASGAPTLPVKRPLSGQPQGGLAKQPKATSVAAAASPVPAGAAGDATASGGAAAASKAKETVRLSPEVAAKLTALKGQGLKVLASGVRAISEAPQQDALAVLQALLQKGKAAGDPTKWVIASLRGRAGGGDDVAAGATAGVGAVAPVPQKAPVSKAPVAKAPIAKAPNAKAPVAKAPLAKAPVAKAPIGKAPVAKAPIAKAPIAKAPVAKAPVVEGPARRPPVPRDGLDFDRTCVQAKLLTLNKQNIWPGEHPLDESALAALLKINTARAIEILEEAEERGQAGTLKDPSAYARRAVALEAKKG
mmetsp:Transcript_130278/g.324852  ORF Transcript_130278/g.324852 Transcript_130278/m.324852 type:complete len:436 (+) Transcript_130278:164-1471(+)